MKSAAVRVGHGTYWYDPGSLRIWWRECMSSLKATNPKDAIGSRKWRQYFVIPARVSWEVGIAHLVGALKYGRMNWRSAGVQASVYVDAARGHIDQWVEGENLDPESRANHIAHAIATLNILLDSILRGSHAWVDDRPPKTPDLGEVRARAQEKVDRLFAMFPDPPPPCTDLNQHEVLPEWNGGMTQEPTEFKVTIKGDKGTYDSVEEWVKSEPVPFPYPRTKEAPIEGAPVEVGKGWAGRPFVFPGP